MADHRSRWLIVPAMLVLLLQATPARAGLVDNFRDWNLYVDEEQAGKFCFILSVPSKSEGTYARRGPAAAYVAKLPSAPPNEQVSVQPGYPFKDASEVDLTIEGRTWKLFTQGEQAWAKNSEDDNAIIEAMKKGLDMSARGTSQKDTFSLDTFSLRGFSAAYEAMQDACKK